MKVRLGFVSNSSSSSFVVDVVYLTNEQLEHFKQLANREYPDNFDDTNFTITKKHIFGEVSMHDNVMNKLIEQVNGEFYC